jgi:uncharacterized integral membrane protein (TIGR00697 family)
MHTLSESSLRKVLIALAIYITSLMAANTLGIKLMPFLFGSHLSVGVFMFPVVFLMTDVIGEVYGKKVAKYFVYAGILSTALFILYNVISIAAPWSPDGLWAKGAYEQIFGVSLRFAIASLIAYAVGEYQDVLSFFFFRQKLGEKIYAQQAAAEAAAGGSGGAGSGEAPKGDGGAKPADDNVVDAEFKEVRK